MIVQPIVDDGQKKLDFSTSKRKQFKPGQTSQRHVWIQNRTRSQIEIPYATQYQNSEESRQELIEGLKNPIFSPTQSGPNTNRNQNFILPSIQSQSIDIDKLKK